MGTLTKPELRQKRLFIAIKINPDRGFYSFYNQIKKTLEREKVRWVNPENFHITMRFLGETDIELIPEISSALLNSMSYFSSFSFTLSGLGVFRSLSHPRVLWMGIKERETLISAKKCMDECLKSIINLKEAKGDNLHLTLGRMKGLSNNQCWKKLLETYNKVDFYKVKVNEVILFESILEKIGPVYIELLKIHLSENI